MDKNQISCKTGTEINEMLVQVCGEKAMKITLVYKWLKHFSVGWKNVTDDERSVGH